MSPNRMWCKLTVSLLMLQVGWLLGLGDRHLDNILLDARSGEPVHIDFAVAFERGRQLRVPELVPFRLTPVLAAALGATGPEGAFRAAAEATLGALRAHGGHLCALLRDALRDARLDWASGHHESRARKVRRGVVVILAPQSVPLLSWVIWEGRSITVTQLLL